MERLYDLAGTIVRVIGADDELTLDSGALVPYEVQNLPYQRTLHIRLTEDLPPPEGICVFTDASRRVYCNGEKIITYIGFVAESVDGADLRMVRTGTHCEALVKRHADSDRIYARTVLTAMEAEHLIIKNNGFLLHASCIEVNGEAILFTAPSGTGKTTQASLWARYRGAEIINGDRIAVCRGISGFEARGVPFAGSSGISKNKKMPLRAIICLAQAKETTIARLVGFRGFQKIWEGCGVYTWSRPDITRCSETVQRLLNEVPVYYMPCTPDKAAVAALEDVLRKE
jgi:hypothetical protein